MVETKNSKKNRFFSFVNNSCSYWQNSTKFHAKVYYTYLNNILKFFEILWTSTIFPPTVPFDPVSRYTPVSSLPSHYFKILKKIRIVPGIRENLQKNVHSNRIKIWLLFRLAKTAVSQKVLSGVRILCVPTVYWMDPSENQESTIGSEKSELSLESRYFCKSFRRISNFFVAKNFWFASFFYRVFFITWRNIVSKDFFIMNGKPSIKC